MKAFIVNRVGDLGLTLGIMATFVVFATIQFDGIFDNAALKANEVFNFFGHNVHALTLICLLLFVGAVGKSAQLGLHTWLPDAMEGPTPVSALIHAATMVTAGVFLVSRFSPVFEYAPDALMVVCFLGALTAIVAATIGMTQFDIKRVIAYSTMSQLGYMFFALGVSAYSAAMFHLVTHAFFKALLFLGAGSVIHAMSGEQDMRNMGGIWKKIPLTYSLIWIGSLALAGIFPFAGFYSKDMILEAEWASNSQVGHFAYWIGIVAALLTAFYSWRLIIMTFHGKPRADHHTMEHVHESPLVMMIPLFVLAIGAVASGFVFFDYFVGEGMTEFWGKSIFVLEEHNSVEHAHHVEAWVKYLPLGIGLAGIVLGYLAYLLFPGIPAKMVSLFRPIHTLFFRKWFFDEIYDAVFVRNAIRLGKFFWVEGDQKTIDGLGPDGIAKISRRFGGLLSRFQSGYVYQYAFVMIIGVFVVISWFAFHEEIFNK